MRRKLHRTCHSCAVAVVNADTSGMDEAKEKKFNEFLDRVGILIHVGRDHSRESYVCEVCGEAGEEHPELFERLA